MTARDDRETATIPDRPGGAARTAAGVESGRFRIVREIARGGMGRVVEAVDLHLGRTVALKQALDDHPDSRMRFEREVEITARLEHPSIVPVYDAGASPAGDPFYVMRKVSGAPLDQLLAGAATLDERLVFLPNLLAVADAVAHAHGRGVIHRDLKPSNVLVGELGETVVIDWGLAKIITDDDVAGSGAATAPARPLATTVGTVIGTPGFMAPEQVTADATDARADVYALGACLYAVLAGRPPFHGLPEAEILDRTADGAPTPLAQVVQGVAPELVTIVEKAMARDPAARYLDAGGLSEDLRRFLTGQLVASHRYRTGQRLVRWLRRHRALVAVIGVALAILIAVGVIAISRIITAQRATARALALERLRSDEIIVTQALSLVDTDPTLAIATLTQLRADSPRWATLGPAVAAIRARGIAVGYPGHGEGVARIEFAHGADDTRVLTAGGGVVRLHDLARRTSTELVRMAAVFAEFAGPLVVITGRPAAHSPYLLDPVTRAEAAVPWPTEIVYSRGGPDALVFVDAAGKVAALDVSHGLPLTAAPVEIPVGFRASFVWLSPRGTWLLVADATRARLLRRDPSALRWDHAVDIATTSHAFAWNQAETRLVATTDPTAHADVVEYDLEAGTERRRWRDQGAFELAYADDQLFEVTWSSGEIRELRADGTTEAMARLEGFSGHSIATFEGSLVMLRDHRTLVASHHRSRHELHPPQAISSIAARPAGRYVVALSSSNVLAWDLAEVLPRRSGLVAAAGIGFVAANDVIAVARHDDTGVQPVLLYALADDPPRATADRRGTLAPVYTPVFMPDGMVVARDPRGAALAVAPGLPRAIADVTVAALAGAATMVVGTVDGTVYEVTPAADRALAHFPGPILSVAAGPGGTIAALVDGVVWRRDPRGRDARIELAGTSTDLAVSAAGDVYVGAGARLIRWPVSGAAPTTVATLPIDISMPVAAVGERIAVWTTDNAVSLYDPATGELRPILPAASVIAFAANRTRVAASVDDAVVVADLATGERWTVIDELPVGPSGLALSPDGRTVAAAEVTDIDPDCLAWWRLDLPPDLHAWTQAATNARKPALSRGTIEWQPLAAPP